MKMKGFKFLILAMGGLGIFLLAEFVLAQDNLPIVSSSNPSINGRTVGISVTGNDDKHLASLAVDWGDGNTSSCACATEEAEYMDSCNQMGNTNCNNTFIHTYSRDDYFTVTVFSVAWPENWVEGMGTQVSETKEHFITIGEPSETPPPWFPINIQVTNPLSAASFEEFIDKLVGFLFTISLFVVPILLVVAGIMFVTGQGDPEKNRKARKMVIFTLIGFAIISLARILVRFIEQIFE